MTDYMYSAFISYRHAEPDQTIARRIQHSIETFQIPAIYRKETENGRAGSHFRKVFRDSDELSLDRDLASGIDYALSQSEYLIVILSPQYKESPWCLHEIEEFLKTHDRGKILCVLAEGEPVDVLPEILTHVPDETGEIVYREPLCADYRLDRATADKLELPRLLCSMLGCSYDDLMKRQEIYRRKQYTKIGAVVLAVVLTIIVLQIRNYAQVSAALERTQYSQSQTLAAQSLHHLESFDRQLALTEAIDALPEPKEDDKPVTTEAVYALAKATYAYRNSAFVQTRKRSMQYEILKFAVTPKLHRIVTMDHQAGILVQSDKGERISGWQIDGTDFNSFGFTIQDDYTILAWRGKNLYSYDYENYKRNWCVNIPGHTGKDVYSLSGIHAVELAGDDACFAVQENDITLIDLEDGSVRAEISMSDILRNLSLPDKENAAMTISRAHASGDGKILFTASLKSPSQSTASLCIGIWDPESGDLTVQTYKDLSAYCIDFKEVAKDRVLVVSADEPFFLEFIDYVSAEILSSEFRTLSILCFDLGEERLMWSYDTEMPQAVKMPEIRYIAPKEAQDPPLVSVTFEVDNYTFDLRSGKLYASVTLPDEIILIDGIDAKSSRFYCCNHKYYEVNHADGSVTESAGFRPFPETVMACSRIGDSIVALSGKDIYWFETVSDTSQISSFTMNAPTGSMQSEDCGENQLAVLMDDTLTVLDLAGYEVLRQVSLNQTEDAEDTAGIAAWKIAGPLPDGKGLLMVGLSYGDNRVLIKAYDAETHEIQTLYTVTISGKESFMSRDTDIPWSDSFVCCNGVLYTVVDTTEKKILYYDAVAEEAGQIEVKGIPDPLRLAGVFTDYVKDPVVTEPTIAVSPDGKVLFSTVYDPSAETVSGAVIDLATGEAKRIDSMGSFSTRSRFVAFNEDHTALACSTDYTILVYGDRFEDFIEIPIQGMGVKSMTWFHDELYVAFTNHMLRRYSGSGDLLSDITLEYSENPLIFGDVKWIPTKIFSGSEEAIIYAEECNMSLISAGHEATTPILSIPHFIGWNDDSDTFLTECTADDGQSDLSDINFTLYLYPHYSYEELVEKGKGQLIEME